MGTFGVLSISPSCGIMGQRYSFVKRFWSGLVDSLSDAILYFVNCGLFLQRISCFDASRW